MSSIRAGNPDFQRVSSIRTGNPDLQRAGDRHARHHERQELCRWRRDCASYPTGEHDDDNDDGKELDKQILHDNYEGDGGKKHSIKDLTWLVMKMMTVRRIVLEILHDNDEDDDSKEDFIKDFADDDRKKDWW